MREAPNVPVFKFVRENRAWKFHLFRSLPLILQGAESLGRAGAWRARLPLMSLGAFGFPDGDEIENPLEEPNARLTRIGGGEVRVNRAFASTTAAWDARERTGVRIVCLSGGVFQNRRLASDLLRRLAADGFEPFINRQVPVNDGGVSYGQAAVAAARLASGAAASREEG